MPDKHYSILCLGDSYTIGEAVDETERFPEQTVKMLAQQGIHFNKPRIIAKTGWTTDELADAIEQTGLKEKFDFVTLLIGVNNEYRGRDLDNYRKEFKALLHTALNYAGNNKNHVVVISIPDWGATPFAAQDPKKRSPQQIAEEIDAFNAVAKQEADKAGVHYIDITPHSRFASNDASLVAQDGLHPSGKMYTYWALQLSKLLAGLTDK